MKRIGILFLIAVMLLPLCSCHRPIETPHTEEDKTREDLSHLSAQELYEKAYGQTAKLSSALFETLVISGENEIDRIRTVRIRSGYDHFSYSRIGKTETLVFSGEKAWVENETGAFSASITPAKLEEYLSLYTVPILSLPAESLSSLSREGMTLSFEVSDAKVLALFAPLLPREEGTLFVKSLSGRATFDENDGVVSETLSLAGTVRESGKECSLTLKTTLKKARSEEIVLEIPTEESKYLPIGDLFIPAMTNKAIRLLAEQDTIQLTRVSSEVLTVGEKQYELHKDGTFYQVGENRYYGALHLKKSPEAEPTNHRIQIAFTASGKTEWIHDAISAELLGEKSGEDVLFSWDEERFSRIPSISGMTDFSLSEGASEITVSFALSEKQQALFAAHVAALFPESGVSLSDGNFKAASGTLSVDAKTGMLKALSFSFSGDFIFGEEIASVTGQYSLQLDQTDAVEVPELFTPVPEIEPPSDHE